MIKDYLNALKNKGNFTAKDIEKLSGIPEATIRKILSGDTSDPRFDTVAKLVTAMGGSMNEITKDVKDDNMESNALLTLKEVYEARIEDYKDRVDFLRRDKRILAIVTGVLIAFVLLFLALDLSIGTIGWVRY